MVLYYLSGEEQEEEKHEVHKLGCEHFPLNAIYLGLFSELEEAMDRARQYYADVESCPVCCTPRERRVFFDPS